MRPPHLCCALVGLCLCTCSKMLSQAVASAVASAAQSGTCQHHAISDSANRPAGRRFWQTAHITGGQLTIPFKIRPKKEHGTFRLTTDVTLGAYIGVSKRLSDTKDYFVTVPMTAGLTFINISDDNTSLVAEYTSADVVPGLTWSSGIILQLEQFNVGLLFGKDYASEVGDQWIYHRKWWWSFGLGFSFLQ